MYKVVATTPKRWNTTRHGHPVLVLENEYGGQSVIGMDDGCFVLYNGSNDRAFASVCHWYREAAEAFAELDLKMARVRHRERTPYGSLFIVDEEPHV